MKIEDVMTEGILLASTAVNAYLAVSPPPPSVITAGAAVYGIFAATTLYIWWDARGSRLRMAKRRAELQGRK